MFYPEKGFLHHPRNKNLSLGALLEALVYTQKTVNIIDPYALGKLRELMEYCTACGKCFSICPVKINSAEVTLRVRSYLEDEGRGGHPLKSKVLSYVTRGPKRMTRMAKAMAVGQNLQNKAVRFIPSFWRRRMDNPVLQGLGPELTTRNLHDILPDNDYNLIKPLTPSRQSKRGVLYFPGCGGGLFFPDIGLAAITLLADCGLYTALPLEHLCCGYPLLAAGCSKSFASLQKQTRNALHDALDQARQAGVSIDTIVTSCGTCRAGLEYLDLNVEGAEPVQIQDVFQYLHPFMQKHTPPLDQGQSIVYHAACHAAWSHVAQDKAASIYARHMASVAGDRVVISPHCCAESGLGALTSPSIYNQLRKRKTNALTSQVEGENTQHILVSCPSCKIGISRIVRNQKLNLQVEHTLEHLANRRLGTNWRDLLTKPAPLTRALPQSPQLARAK
jgi:Fe-S oxidoreductase